MVTTVGLSLNLFQIKSALILVTEALIFFYLQTFGINHSKLYIQKIFSSLTKKKLHAKAFKKFSSSKSLCDHI